MTYTILPGEKAPNFEGLKGTDGNLYGLNDIGLNQFRVIFLLFELIATNSTSF